MKVRAAKPPSDTQRLLPGANFVDAFSLIVRDGALDARQAAELMLARPPAWIDALMTLRNAAVKPLGLKAAVPGNAGPDSIGIFPVISTVPVAK
jgi:Protein of unknown function (DUF2867)